MHYRIVAVLKTMFELIYKLVDNLVFNFTHLVLSKDLFLRQRSVTIARAQDKNVTKISRDSTDINTLNSFIFFLEISNFFVQDIYSVDEKCTTYNGGGTY